MKRNARQRERDKAEAARAFVAALRAHYEACRACFVRKAGVLRCEKCGVAM